MLAICYNGIQATLSPSVHTRRRSMVLSSTAPSTSTESSSSASSHRHLSVDDYLVNSLGLSREDVVASCVQVSRLRSKKNADSVVKFLETSGMDNTQIQRFVVSVPTLLNCNLKRTEPKFRVLLDLGFSGDDLIDLICYNPTFMRRGLESFLLPSICVLRSVLGCDQNVVKAVKKWKWLLARKPPHKLQENVAFLQKCGLSDDKIRRLVLMHPQSLLYNLDRLQDSLVKVEFMLGISRESGMFELAFQTISTFTEERLRLKFEVFKRCGWNEKEITKLAKGLPAVLKLSNATITSRLRFLMDEMGYEPGYIASRPRLMGHSMKKRVVPRNVVLQILKERKLLKRRQTLSTVLRFTEAEFLNRYIVPYKDVLPQLLKIYLNSKAETVVGSND